MKTIAVLRNPKYVKRDALSATKYSIEIAESVEPAEANQNRFSYRLIRVLAAEDVDVKRWLSTASLAELPVSPEPSYTPEELLWSGKREGNLVGGIALAAVTAGAIALALAGYILHGSYILFILAAAISGFYLIKYQWKAPKPCDPEKLRELDAYKQNLRQQHRFDQNSARTQFEAALGSFEYWEALSAEQFELALSLRLQKEGYGVKITRYSKDGGVDIEATDKLGKPIIVQAKKYRSNVGVNVVREMIGVREGRIDKPRTMIYSLSGFTSGAKDLAEKSGIELRDVRSELLKI